MSSEIQPKLDPAPRDVAAKASHARSQRILMEFVLLLAFR